MVLKVLFILFWILVVVALMYFIVQWAKSDAIINNQASGLSSVEHIDVTEDEPRIPRIAGKPVSYPPQEGIEQIAAQERERAAEDSTQETPVYLGDNSSVVPVHLK